MMPNKRTLMRGARMLELYLDEATSDALIVADGRAADMLHEAREHVRKARRMIEAMDMVPRLEDY